MEQLPDGKRGPVERPRRAKVLTQVVLPLAIFVAAVAGFTFVSQYGPGRGKNAETPAPPPVDPLKFSQTKTIWDLIDKDFVAEFENQEGKPQYRVGQYHFVFRNPHDVPVDLGFIKKSCTCSQVNLCFLTPDEADALMGPLGPRDYPDPLGYGGALYLTNRGFGGREAVAEFLGHKLDWTELNPKYKEEGIRVPPGGAGLIRLAWDGYKRESGRLGFNVTLWAQLSDQKVRKVIVLEGRVSFVPPVRTYPGALTIENWAGDQAKSEFYCWSSTRPSFALTTRTDDPCIEARAERLTADECRALEHNMNFPPEQPGEAPKARDYHKHVASAYRVRVTVSRRQGDRQLEQGHFQRWVYLKSPAAPTIDPVKVDGFTPAEVTVEGAKDEGKIHLGTFRGSQGKTKPIFLLVKPGVELLPDKTERKPNFVELKWHEPKKAPGGVMRWQVDVTIPANARAAWPRDAALILHTKQDDQSEGRVRVPIVANPYR
jgi:hypothetical protein